MDFISASSFKRFQTVISGLNCLRPEGQKIARVALADRQQPTVVRGLSVETRRLLDNADEFDLIVLDSDAARRLPSESFNGLAARLDVGGMIAIREQTAFFPFGRGFQLRRTDDAGANPFLRGLPRSEAAIRGARLYTKRLKVRLGRFQTEHWLIGSREPLQDTRFRDQIGRVAPDYLRGVGPVIASVNLLGL